MKLDELFRRFNSWEKENDIYEKEIDGICFWKRVRHLVYDDIRDEQVFKDKSAGRVSLKDRFERLYLLFRNIFIRNPFLSKESDVVVVGQSRRKKIEGEWWDIYSDYLLEDLDSSYTYLDEIYPGTNGHKHPMKTSNVRYLDLIRFTPALLNRLGIVNLDIEEEEREMLKELSDSLEDRFDVSIDVEELVIRDLKKRKVKIRLYRKLLKRVDPEIVLLVKATRYTLNEACEQLDIPTVELQHGVIHEYHRGYSYPEIPQRTLYSADHLFSWGSFWTESMTLPFDKEKVSPVGFPHFEKRRESYERDPRDEILFISQPNSFHELSEIAMQLDEELSDHKMKFKIHPKNVDWEEEKPELSESGVEVVYDERPLYEMFSTARYQIGVSSTAIYEGLGFGIKTMIYDAEGKEITQNLLDEGHAVEVSDAEDVKEFVRQKSSDEEIDSERFFRPNSLKNMKKAIDDIMK